VVLIVLAILIFVFPQNIFFIIFAVYALSGFITLIIHIVHRRKNPPATAEEEKSFKREIITRRSQSSDVRQLREP